MNEWLSVNGGVSRSERSVTGYVLRVEISDSVRVPLGVKQQWWQWKLFRLDVAPHVAGEPGATVAFGSAFAVGPDDAMAKAEGALELHRERRLRDVVQALGSPGRRRESRANLVSLVTDLARLNDELAAIVRETCADDESEALLLRHEALMERMMDIRLATGELE